MRISIQRNLRRDLMISLMLLTVYAGNYFTFDTAEKRVRETRRGLEQKYNQHVVEGKGSETVLGKHFRISIKLSEMWEDQFHRAKYDPLAALNYVSGCKLYRDEKCEQARELSDLTKTYNKIP